MSEMTNALQTVREDILAEVRHCGTLIALVRGDVSPRDLNPDQVEELTEFLINRAGVAARAAQLTEPRTRTRPAFEVVGAVSFDKSDLTLPPAA